MAVNVLIPLLIPLGEQITNVTRLTDTGSLAFTQVKYDVTVAENTAPVLLLNLQAKSNTTTSTVYYSLVSSPDKTLYSVDPYTGKVVLNAPLDYELRPTHELIVGARAGEESAYGRVLIQVRDDNDHRPTFPRPLYETQITEEDDRHLPKSILEVAAIDVDVLDRESLTYVLSGDGASDDPENPDKFDIGKTTGIIRLLKPLNRDPPEGKQRWELQVRVSDGIHETTTEVHVNLKDINDNEPFFPNTTMNAAVPENLPEGQRVTRVRATDNDDVSEGTNARLVYSIEKNVIDETSGKPIFSIDPNSGIISTALCCLDREKTPSYAIQVVATDGGGLKGTGTVVVAVEDENDEAPRFVKPDWSVSVHESSPTHTSLALLTIKDADISNRFAFRVLPNSGFGWDRFRIVTSREGNGVLQAVMPLDYEDSAQRNGFRFKIQVTDRGYNWFTESHIDTAWLNVTLLDDNDNTPEVPVPVVNLTLTEDVPLGHVITSFSATDEDKGGRSKIHYTIDPKSDPGRQFTVDSEGRVRLRRRLDRETTERHTVHVLAVDDGSPPLTATATLLLTLTDVNDNPPHIASSTLVVVQENAGPKHVAEVHLGDNDDWSLGHGPPFTVAIDNNSPSEVKDNFAVDFDPKGDGGRGVAVVSTSRSLDREAGKTRFVPLVLQDHAKLTTTATLTVVVGDVNDNAMSPASKTVTVRRLKTASSPIPLGRVYVSDPDDWDVADKEWWWRRGQEAHHSLFSLDHHSGTVWVLPTARDGTYSLQFSVSDPHHGQSGVDANVTVQVTTLDNDVVNSAVPIVIQNMRPRDVILEDQSDHKTPIDRLLSACRQVVEIDVGVLALEGSTPGRTDEAKSRVWLRPLQPLRQSLHQLLLLHRKEVGEVAGLSLGRVGNEVCREEATEPSHAAPTRLPPPQPPPPRPRPAITRVANGAGVMEVVEEGGGGDLSCGSGCQVEVEALRPEGHTIDILEGKPHIEPADDPFVWVVDANVTAVVGPRMPVTTQCSCPALPYRIAPDSCHPNPCLNEGRCVSGRGRPRCICPQGTVGRLCKILSREFDGGGWVWLPGVPTCSRLHISLEVRTRSPDALLMYSGPQNLSADYGSGDASTDGVDVLSLELHGGRPRLLLDLGASPILLSLAKAQTYSLADGLWHRIDLIWGDEIVELIVDLCKDGGLCRVAAPLPPHARVLNTASPLQMGGLAHAPPDHNLYGWPVAITSARLKGCARNLRMNGKLYDLGNTLLAKRSSPGCRDDECLAKGLDCGPRGRCSEWSVSPECECDPGWTGPRCREATLPTSLKPHSYIKMALSFTPPTHCTTLQLRFRTWEQTGQLILVTSQHGRDSMVLHLSHGHLCLELSLPPDPVRNLCLSSVPLNDGRWHTARADRYGPWLELTADEGEGEMYNVTLAPGSQRLLRVDKQEGLHIGGKPEYVGVSVFKVHHDYQRGCLDDVRLGGRPLPLPPGVNGTDWAQATMFRNVQRTCVAPPSCANVSCPAPFTCIDTWRNYECGCAEGRALTSDRTTCKDEDECVWSPCLNGGTCSNRDPGFVCICPRGFVGEHCGQAATESSAFQLSMGALAAIIIWCFLLIMIIVAYLVHHQYKQRTLRKSLNDSQETSTMSFRERHSSSPIHGTQCSGHSTTAELLELKVLQEPKANGGPAWTKASKSPVGNDPPADSSSPKGNGGEKCTGCPLLPTVDDLRYYAYEGSGSSPGSLSSCCSGADAGGETKLLGGFQEVASLLNCLNNDVASNQSPSRTQHTKEKGQTSASKQVLGSAFSGSDSKGKEGQLFDKQKPSRTNSFKKEIAGNGTHTLRTTQVMLSSKAPETKAVSTILIGNQCNSLPRTKNSIGRCNSVTHSLRCNRLQGDPDPKTLTSLGVTNGQPLSVLYHPRPSVATCPTCYCELRGCRGCRSSPPSQRALSSSTQRTSSPPASSQASAVLDRQVCPACEINRSGALASSGSPQAAAEHHGGLRCCVSGSLPPKGGVRSESDLLVAFASLRREDGHHSPGPSEKKS